MTQRHITDKLFKAFNIAIEALEEIACVDDERANHRLKKTGSYSSFDEPGSVYKARKAIKQIKAILDDAKR